MSSASTARMIGAIFGLVFVLVNAGVLDPPASWMVRGLGVVAFAAVVWRARGLGDTAVQPRPSALRVYWASVVLEVIALALGSRLLSEHGHGVYGVAWVAFVVGLHFVPFAWAFRTPSFFLLGLVLVFLAALGAVVGIAGAGDAAIAVVAGIGAGCALMGWAVVPSLVRSSPTAG